MRHDRTRRVARGAGRPKTRPVRGLACHLNVYQSAAGARPSLARYGRRKSGVLTGQNSRAHISRTTCSPTFMLGMRGLGIVESAGHRSVAVLLTLFVGDGGRRWGRLRRRRRGVERCCELGDSGQQFSTSPPSRCANGERGGDVVVEISTFEVGGGDHGDR
ncbi:hypothetical protein SCHPADRAFT_756017 [Schizopora paradoxa]|uniref:Uncharacterized protein n=1 Tax=Schizopora paradoxa TaxID=27342 RepID=A0A0H2R4F8_9AGAM|nr:hypothetical protein SCHPADRAFT_756017 [Schizopora paradoxa]